MSLGLRVFLFSFDLFSMATATAANNVLPTCRYELYHQGYTTSKQLEFCRSLNADQWTCGQAILKKYHSLELAKDTCLNASSGEAKCHTQVIQRNYDPYVAKRVCRIKP